MLSAASSFRTSFSRLAAASRRLWESCSAAARNFAATCFNSLVNSSRRSSECSMELFDSSPDGSLIAYTLNDEGVSRLMLPDQRLQLDRRVDALAPGLVTALRFD